MMRPKRVVAIISVFVFAIPLIIIEAREARSDIRIVPSWRYFPWSYGVGWGIGAYPYYTLYEPQLSPTDQEIMYCARRFRSYDRATQTYLGNDRLPHPCP
jgi:hypothetical protein